MRPLLKRTSSLVKSVHNRPSYGRILVLAAGLAGKSSSSTKRTLIVIAPPGGGNIGDEALVLAVLTAGDFDERILVTRKRSDIRAQSLGGVTFTLMTLPKLVYGRGVSQAFALRSLSRLLGKSTSVAVIGADIMDGAYNESASVNRFRIAEFAVKRGSDARVIGFSWNQSPKASSTYAAGRAAAHGVDLCARDPDSFRRLQSDLGHDRCRLTADVAFTLDASDIDQVRARELLVGAERFPDKHYVVVNVSGLVDKKLDQTDGYVSMIRSARAAGLSVVVLPHVIRATGDDLVPCRRVYKPFEDDAGVVLVTGLLYPREVLDLVSRSWFCVSGRMHLSVFAISNGVPAITIATQGKVAGLLESVGMGALLVDPTTQLESQMMRAYQLAKDPNTQLRTGITALLPIIKARSLSNFDGWSSSVAYVESREWS